MDASSPLPTGPVIASDGCLGIDVLVEMAEGTLAAERIEAVLAHVDCCARCAEVISNLGALDGPGRRVGRYQIERVLGVGGMGIVYAAYDPQLQRKVALKLVRPENTTEVAQSLMVAEARTLARISHPNVVTVFDAGEHDGEIYLATELVEGMTFRAWQAQPRTTAEIIAVWLQVARGLAAAHAMQVVHCDVKPSNVLVGDDGRVRIGDFGLAHRETALAAPTVPKTVLAGTPAYMAPEHRAGRVDARSDQFSACVVIVEALTGQRPVAGAEVRVEPPALAAVLWRGLRGDPDERFPTMDAFADALAAAIAPRPPRRRWIVPAVMAAAVAGGLVMGWALCAPARCAVAAVPDGVWAARRAALVPRLPADITPYVERWLGAWANAAGDVCTSHDPAMRARRQACLDRTLARLDGLLARWSASPPPDALAMFIALDKLPRVAWCSEAALAESPGPAPAR
jgi:eukaryotic-like serine/threonine-protein kinase